MSLDDRLGFLVLGCVIGFVIGYITRKVQDSAALLDDIKHELDEVDEIVKKDHFRDERGSVSIKDLSFPGIALICVVLLTAYAAFASQNASNDVKETQNRLNDITSCNQEFLTKTILALNERTTYTQEQSNANVALQKSQAAFFEVLLHKPPYSEAKREAAVQKYFEDLTNFIVVSGKQSQKTVANPYPTEEELTACLRGD